MTSVARSTPFYFGGAASCVATCVVHPFDLAKVRLQTTKGIHRASMLATMIAIGKNEGLIRLYAGLSASLLRQATYSTVRFGAYDKLKQMVQSKTEHPTVWHLLACSTTAGAMGGACGNPGDIVNVRMQNDGQLPPHQRRHYKHALDGIIRMSKEEGISSLFRGIGPNISRAILVTSSQCVSYDIFKNFFLTQTFISDGLGLHFLSSVMAGFVATTVCSPVDVIKTRIMSSSAADRKLSSLNIMAQMYKAEGLRAFFKGWTPAFIRLGPQTTITFVVMERFKAWHAAWIDGKTAVINVS
ncbi:mitochondrial carrier domain-containing protein [Radiomyces spectabilis]|uniref:mitochondrial carrier domain-containing protein n=1 Tax=Radiomyces spectabilis TaxID=64574 RepID=UPI00222043F9|nr:mitochondrial carrier domain-containing protein [Radiomyces spectabilis]KAI8384573.1 mitochondrial carrier domain-containing protein [Radiomyces spectabilis]